MFSSLRTILLGVSVASVAAINVGCGDDDVPGGGNADAAELVDADPTAPDADTTPDADPSQPDANTSPDAGGGSPGVDCGMMTCNPGQDCCVTQGGMGGGASTDCVPTGTCTGATVLCDGPEDCPTAGDVCCGSLGGGGGGSAECSAGNSCQFAVCHVPADCPNPTDNCCDYGFGSSVCQAFPCF